MLRREVIESLADATTQLTLLAAYKAERKLVKSGEITDLKALGKKLLDRARNTDLSTYSYEHTMYKEPTFDEDKPEIRKAIVDHEAWVASKLVELKKLFVDKKEVLDDHLKREQFAMETRRLADEHNDKFTQLQAWVANSEQYLKAREHIHSIAEAKTALTLLAAYHSEKDRMTSVRVTDFNAIGADVLKRKYGSAISEYYYGMTCFHC